MESGGHTLSASSRTKANVKPPQKNTPPVKRQSDKEEDISYVVDDKDVFCFMKEMCMNDLNERASELGVVIGISDENGFNGFYLTGEMNKIDKMKREIDALRAKLTKSELYVNDRDVEYLRSDDGKQFHKEVEKKYCVHCDVQNGTQGANQSKDKVATKLAITGRKDDVEKAEVHMNSRIRNVSQALNSSTVKLATKIKEKSSSHDPLATKLDNGCLNDNLNTLQPGPVSKDFTKEIQLPTDVSMELLLFFLGDLITQYKEIGFKMEFKDTSIVLHGDKIMITSMSTKFNSAIQKLKDIQCLIIDVSTIEKDKITRLQKRYENKQVLCTLSKSLKEMHLYGYDYRETQKEMHQMEVSLGLRSTTQRSSLKLVDDDNTVSEQSNVNRNLTTEYKPQPFSWSTDAKHLQVFHTKENLIVKVYEADILCVPVDCIVNAANKDLDHGGGVAKVIAEAAGKDLDKEGNDYLSKHGKLAVGEACITTAGKLPFDCVVHTVDPCWSDYKPHTKEMIDRCEIDLYDAVINALRKATKRNLKTVAFPAISAAIFACPKELCCVQYAKALKDYSRCSNISRLSEVHFVDVDVNIVKLVQKTFDSMIPAGHLPKFYNKMVYVQTAQHRSKNSLSCDSARKNTDDDAAVFDPRCYLPHPTTPRGSGTSGKNKTKWSLSPFIKLQVYTADLLALKGIDMIVCTSFPDGNSKGALTEALRKAGGSRYTNTIDKEFKLRTVKEGDVIVCNGTGTGFNLVAHAILVKSGYENRRQQVNSIFEKIFQEASLWHCSSIALPLLGTGKGGADPIYYTERLWESLLGFAKHSKTTLTVHLVNKDGTKTAKAVDVILDTSTMNQSKKSTFQQTVTHHHPNNQCGKTTSDYRNQKQPAHKPAAYVRTSKGTNGAHAGGLNRTSAGSTHQSSFRHGDKHDTNYEPRERKRSCSPSASQGSQSDDREEGATDCVICMDSVKDPKTLPCGHVFCIDCIEQQFKHKKACPTCGKVCGIITGDQPSGKMNVNYTTFQSCAGYEKYGRIDITYSFPDGKQEHNHPSPGKRYRGFTRTAYLPDNQEGQHICAMLKVAFDRKLIFTIGSSRTTGHEGVITYNDIHLKTDPKPNKQFGYPDPTYIDRVTDELKAKGVTTNDIQTPSSERR